MAPIENGNMSAEAKTSERSQWMVGGLLASGALVLLTSCAGTKPAPPSNVTVPITAANVEQKDVPLQLRAIGSTAEKLGKTLLPLRIDNVDMIRNALERVRSEKIDGLVFLSSPIFTANAARVVELAQPIALPAI